MAKQSPFPTGNSDVATRKRHQKFPAISTKLKQHLTLYGLTMIAVGSCIGSGIFVTPQQIAAAVPNAGLFLAVWALGSRVALAGALTFTE